MSREGLGIGGLIDIEYQTVIDNVELRYLHYIDDPSPISMFPLWEGEISPL